METWFEIVHSPDDGGWYVEEFCRVCGRFRSSEIFDTYYDAKRAHSSGDITWSPWG